MATNFSAPSTSTTPVFITDTYAVPGGSTDNIPSFPTTEIDGKDVPLSASLLIDSKYPFGLNNMTTDQIASLVSLRNGMLTYNSTTNAIDARIDGAWTSLAAGGSGTAYGPGEPLYLSANETNSFSISLSSAAVTGTGNTVLGSGSVVTKYDNSTIIGFGSSSISTSSATYSGNTILGAQNTIKNSLNSGIWGYASSCDAANSDMYVIGSGVSVPAAVVGQIGNSLIVGSPNKPMLEGISNTNPQYALDIGSTVINGSNRTAIKLSKNSLSGNFVAGVAESYAGILYIDDQGTLWYQYEADAPIQIAPVPSSPLPSPSSFSKKNKDN